MTHTAIINLLLGVLLLFLGRRLFWLFVGVAGFLVGLNFAAQIATGSESSRLLIALIAGILGAVLAVLLQKVAIAIAGFIIGAYLGVDLLRSTMAAPAQWNLAAYIIGGIIGAVLIILLFDWALILLSSLSGASLVIHNIRLAGGTSSILFACLVILGILVQAGIMHSTRTASA
jgi:hypothetical protein